jgi:hypothetical protein
VKFHTDDFERKYILRLFNTLENAKHEFKLSILERKLLYTLYHTLDIYGILVWYIALLEWGKRILFISNPFSVFGRTNLSKKFTSKKKNTILPS